MRDFEKIQSKIAEVMNEGGKIIFSGSQQSLRKRRLRKYHHFPKFRKELNMPNTISWNNKQHLYTSKIIIQTMNCDFRRNRELEMYFLIDDNDKFIGVSYRVVHEAGYSDGTKIPFTFKSIDINEVLEII